MWELVVLLEQQVEGLATHGAGVLLGGERLRARHADAPVAARVQRHRAEEHIRGVRYGESVLHS